MYPVVAFDLNNDTKDYAKKLFELRNRGWGDGTDAVEACAKMAGMSPRSFKRLMDGDTKNASSFFGNVRKAYLNYCAQMATKLQADIESERGKYGDVRIGDLADQVAALAQRIEAARAVRIKEQKGR